MSQKAKCNIILFFTAVIWGSGFVAQKAAAELQPFTYCGIRMTLGGLALIPVILLMDKRKSESRPQDKRLFDSATLKGGLICGVVLCIASNLQQFGIYFQSDVGKAGFITSLYIVFVPIIGLLFGKRAKPIVWGCIALGAFGFYLLTMAGKDSGFRLQSGDFFLLLCSFAFACHIVAVDRFSPSLDGIKLSCVQFLTSGILSLILMFIFETPTVAGITEFLWPLLYSALIPCCLGFTLQVIGQQHAEPATATLLLSLEAVFATIFGVLIMGERLSIVELLGCAVIFIAVLVPQMPDRKIEKRV